MRLYDICLRNFWENSVLTDTEREVAIAIETSRRNTSEIPHSRKNDRYEFLEEVIHTISSKCHHHTDWHTFTELEVRDRLTRVRHRRELSGDKCEVIFQRGKVFVSRCNICPNTHVQDNLLNMRRLHWILYLE